MSRNIARRCIWNPCAPQMEIGTDLFHTSIFCGMKMADGSNALENTGEELELVSGRVNDEKAALHILDFPCLAIS